MPLMLVSDSVLDGVKILRHHRVDDHRGDFSRLFCKKSLEMSGLSSEIAQINYTRTKVRGSLRGLHFQAAPYGERKIISCLHGSVFDVVVDIRPNSSTRWQWQSVELHASCGFSLVVPPGFAHGFQALSDDAEMLYLHDCPYVAEAQKGFHYNDPLLNITWPLPLSDISEKDANFAFINSRKYEE